MSEQYKHLRIEKEVLTNPRRTIKRNPPRNNPGDLQAHGQKLANKLKQAAETARQQLTSQQGNFVFKLKYVGALDVKHLHKHGVDFVSQEDKEICIVFADEQGLAIFAEHLSALGADDWGFTHKNILEALTGIDNWAAEDRKSWAFRHRGLPDGDSFKLDVELWPIENSRHAKRVQLIENFERWLKENKIQKIDSLNQDSLLMYRLEVTPQHAELLLNLREIRMVDLLPETGINYQQLNVDVANIPENIPPPALGSSRVCILDSGINANHPLLKSAIADSQSYIEGQDVNDQSGHGTGVAGIALYGDLEACAEANYWNPQFWLYNGKVMYLDEGIGETRFDEKTIESMLTGSVKYFAGELGCRILALPPIEWVSYRRKHER